MAHYVPVLRWKGAEIAAVLDLSTTQRQRMKPLFELLPKSFEELPVERAVALTARAIAINWGWNSPCFIDLSLLDPIVARSAFSLLDHQPHLAATLTTALQSIIEPQVLRDFSRVKQYGLCIRLQAHEFRQIGFQKRLLDLVGGTQLTTGDVDLIIDYGLVTEAPVNMAQLVDTLTLVGDWRSITLLAGAFPPDLTKLKKNNQYLLPRHDWIAYCKYRRDGGTAGFGDYTIQHPIYEEHEGKGLNFSASIRYAGLADWVIMRGESVRTDGGPGYAQWPANAQLLCEHSEYLGKEFSAGDDYIKTMSQQMQKTGGPKEWLTAGINHHLALVVHQLEHIAEMPVVSATADVAAPDWPAHYGQLAETKPE